MVAHRTLSIRGGGLNPPPSERLSWPRPNHTNPETRPPTVSHALIALLVITFVVYAARMWARLVIARNAGLDDFLMSIAMVLVVGSTIAVVLGIRVYGFQWHVWDQTERTHVTTRQITLAIEMLYLWATTLIKISILCFYRRLAENTLSKTFRYCVQASIAAMVLYGLIFFFVVVFAYTPIEGNWRIFDFAWRAQNDMSSLDEAAIIVSCTVIGTLQDIVICALPMILVWNLHIPRRQKIGLLVIFGVGIITCVCCIMRTYYAVYIYYYTYDITWYAFEAWIWTALEADLGVMCASAPALRVFFRRYFGASTDRSGSTPRRNAWPGSKATVWKPRGWKADPALKLRSGDANGDVVPLSGITISTCQYVRTEERRDGHLLSGGSKGSTSNLTALPRA